MRLETEKEKAPVGTSPFDQQTRSLFITYTIDVN